MGTTDILIEADDLQRSFGAKAAVKGISFTARRGEIFGLLGPNGAGKTTTIRLLSGQIAPSGGSAQVAGCDVTRQHARLKERIGVVFEEQNLYERLSARRNLDLSRRIYGLPASRIDEVLALVRLRDRAKDPVRVFSNGMRQRLMIARALLHRPQVLFLDEPSRGLDPLSAREVRQAITQLSQEGMTILLTTHLMEEADQLCQHVAFLVDGRIVANDTPRALKLEHGQRTLTVTLSGEKAATMSDTSFDDTLSDVTLRMDDASDQAQLLAWIARGDVRAIHSREATLEEVFVEVAGVRPD